MAASFMGCVRLTSTADPWPVEIVSNMPRQADPSGHLDRLDGKIRPALAHQKKSAHADHKHAGQRPAAHHGMTEFVDSHRRKSHGPEICHLVAHHLGIEGHAVGILHPGVGHQNPQCRYRRPYGREPCRYKVKTRAHALPAENITAMNVASIKKANSPSIARGAPNISPTNQE